jgi:MFS transporter, OFA family, oxalate/formate antiporter
VGAAGAIANASGRIIWGWLSDIWGYRRTFVALACAQAILHTLYPYSAVAKPMFMMSHILSHLFLGGNFAIFPPATVKLFGGKKGTAIYGLIFSAFGTASLGGIFISKVLFHDVLSNLFC